jgi:hypothetical protein
MISLETKKCEKHTPHTEAISTIVHNFDEDTQFTFCEICEQNITRFSFWDYDRGIVYTKWSLTN